MTDATNQDTVLDSADAKSTKPAKKAKSDDAKPVSLLASLQEEALSLARSGDVQGESALSVTIGKLYDLKKHLADVEHEALAGIKALLE